MLVVGVQAHCSRLAAISAVACVAGEVWLTPDLDLGRGCAAYRWWVVLAPIWRPYARLVPHRAAWSHWPVLGMALRIAYVGVPVVLGFMVAGHDLELERWAQAHRSDIVAAYLGLETAGTLHWVADRFG
jgi:uncharacterized metal-binding protein